MIRDSGKMWNAAGELAGHQGGHPRLVVRRRLRRGRRRLPRPRRVRPGDHGLGPERRAHGAAGRGVRLARQDLRDPRRRHRARREPRRRRRDAARGRGGRRLARLPGEGRTRARLGRARGPTRRASAVRPSSSGSTRRVRTTRSSSPRCGSTSRSTTRRGSTIEIMAPADACALLARAHPSRRGHDLGHRQRAARLPHRPLPDHGARHQRQDALDRAAHERRRPVRDRRGRVGAEARAAVREGEPPPLGLAR